MTEPLDPPEWTEADFESAIKASVRRRIMTGVIEPGDVEALRRFVRLTNEQFAKALGIHEETLNEWNRVGVTMGPGRALLMIAARRPRAIRDNLMPPTADPQKRTLTVGRHRVLCEYTPVELSDGSLGITSDELERMELCAAIAVFSEPTAFIGGAEMRCARKILGHTQLGLDHILRVNEGDVAAWEASPDPVAPDRRQAMLTFLERDRARAHTGHRNVRLLSPEEAALHEESRERRA